MLLMATLGHRSTVGEECGLRYKKGEDGRQTDEEGPHEAVVKTAANWKSQNERGK